jgi:hypothetical protein
MHPGGGAGTSLMNPFIKPASQPASHQTPAVGRMTWTIESLSEAAAAFIGIVA